jgi:two-component system chemotaxis response regulator CheY
VEGEDIFPRPRVNTVMVSCLLLNDNTLESARIAGLLGELGIHCTVMVDVEDGIRFANSSAPDVVLVEATTMPRAREFMGLVRNQNRNTGRPVVILYATSATVSEMGEGILNGASEFMMAPFDVELLEFKLLQSGVLKARAA